MSILRRLHGHRTVVTCDGCRHRSPNQPTVQAAEEYAVANKWTIPTSTYALGDHYCPDCSARLILLAKTAAALYLGATEMP